MNEEEGFVWNPSACSCWQANPGSSRRCIDLKWKLLPRRVWLWHCLQLCQKLISPPPHHPTHVPHGPIILWSLYADHSCTLGIHMGVIPKPEYLGWSWWGFTPPNFNSLYPHRSSTERWCTYCVPGSPWSSPLHSNICSSQRHMFSLLCLELLVCMRKTEVQDPGCLGYVQGWACYSSLLWQTRKALSPLPRSYVEILRSPNVVAWRSWQRCTFMEPALSFLIGVSWLKLNWGICPTRRTPGLMLSCEPKSRFLASRHPDQSTGRCSWQMSRIIIFPDWVVFPCSASCQSWWVPC